MASAASPAENLGVTTPLGSALKIDAFSGHEEISGLFHFQLALFAANSASVPFKSLIGQPVNVRLGSRYFHGIVRRFSEGGRTSALTSYNAEVVPSLWLLTLKKRSRIFQDMSVPDILKKLFVGFPVTYQLNGTFPPRNYCVQYRESDFEFASRIMEEEGIYYYFKHAAAGHTLVVGNAPTGFPPLAAPIPYDRTGATDGAAGVIYAWEKEQQLRSGLVTLRDHAFELPTNALEAQAHIQETVQAGAVTHWLHVAGNDGLENYDYPGGYAKRFDAGHGAEVAADGARTVGIRMQEEALASLHVDGKGNAEKFSAGASFTLKSHFDGNGAWAITSVDHSARARKSASAPATYTNGFTCIPAALPFRPPRTTPQPRIDGVQTAVVVGPAGEEIYTDRYGRVKVQFFWDRQGKKDENSSCWVRVAHPTSIPGTQPPPIPVMGTEVVVAFEEGDPDRPLIIGTVDNTQRPLP